MDDIKKLITQKEGRKLEFKEKLPAKDKIVKTAIAFSNSQGGNLIIGIADNGSILGIADENIIKYEEIISNTIYDNCFPNIMPEIYSVRINDKALLVVHFYPSSQKPHYIKKSGKLNGAYIRVGSTNRLATTDILERLEREKRQISFDSVVNYDFEYYEGIFDKFDKHIVSKLKEEPSLKIYEKLKFIKKERDSFFLTNLGILFSSRRDDYFPLVKIECARFKGTSTEVFLDQATFAGDIIDSIEKSIDFVKRNIKLSATIGEVYRENRWEYPLLALREIIINAVVHRDYSVLGSDIKIAIFDDMLEVTSPGVFLIDKDKLGYGYSELRNQNLGNLFKKLEIIEQWGTGFNKVDKALSEYPDIELEIDDESSFTQVRLVKQKTTQETEKTTQETEKTTQETEKTTQEMTTRERILFEIRKNGSLTREDLAKMIGVSSNTIKQHFSNLKKEGVLKRIGSTKAGYWKVVGEF